MGLLRQLSLSELLGRVKAEALHNEIPLDKWSYRSGNEFLKIVKTKRLSNLFQTQFDRRGSCGLLGIYVSTINSTSLHSCKKNKSLLINFLAISVNSKYNSSSSFSKTPFENRPQILFYPKSYMTLNHIQSFRTL